MKILICNKKIIFQNYNQIKLISDNKIIIDNYKLSGYKLYVLELDEYYIKVTGIFEKMVFNEENHN